MQSEAHKNTPDTYPMGRHDMAFKSVRRSLFVHIELDVEPTRRPDSRGHASQKDAQTFILGVVIRTPLPSPKVKSR